MQDALDEIIEDASRRLHASQQNEAALQHQLDEAIAAWRQEKSAATASRTKLADKESRLASAIRQNQELKTQASDLQQSCAELQREKIELDSSCKTLEMELEAAKLCEREAKRDGTEGARRVSQLEARLGAADQKLWSERDLRAEREVALEVERQRVVFVMGMLQAALGKIEDAQSGTVSAKDDLPALRRNASRARLSKTSLSAEGERKIIEQARRLGVLPPAAEGDGD